jgi:hypothetical protein
MHDQIVCIRAMQYSKMPLSRARERAALGV